MRAQSPVGARHNEDLLTRIAMGCLTARLIHVVEWCAFDQPVEFGQRDVEQQRDQGTASRVDAGSSGFPLGDGVFGNTDLVGKCLLVETGPFAGVGQSRPRRLGIWLPFQAVH